ncbi:MAG: hypothetical protein Q9209_002465 [Squamulea sp. 1 TL-2023]
MGRGVLPDSHPLNTASARSTALREADVVLLLGAPFNWILHFGSPPKWSPSTKFIQIDVSADELGKNAADPALPIHGDIATVLPQLQAHLSTWRYDPKSSPYTSNLQAAKEKNLAIAAKKAADTTLPMTHSSALPAIKRTLHCLSPPDDGRIVYISKGANTMDISRSIFPPLTLPWAWGWGMPSPLISRTTQSVQRLGKQRLTPLTAVGKSGKKTIVCLEGDSAFGFSAMEVETTARYGMDILIFVINIVGVYHGDADDEETWQELRDATLGPGSSDQGDKKGLRSTSLKFGTRYEDLASIGGGMGLVAGTPKEVEEATRKG